MDRIEFEIAIIGMAAKIGPAQDIESFWNLVLKGKEAISRLDKEELIKNGESESLISDPAYVNAKGKLEGKEYFDSAFFNYSPGDAELLEVQTRLLHEYVWKALEDSGYDPGKTDQLIGLYAGGTSNYWDTIAFTQGHQGYDHMQLANRSFMATRVSHKLDLKGPSLFIDSACSTSLVAVHQACQSLLSGDCDMAVAGGVSTYPVDKGYLYQEGMILSPDGHCRPFDKNAKGTVPGEGIGVVVLKRLEEAIEDNDTIYATIKASGINNDGARKVGYTAPSVQGQVELIKRVQQMAEVTPEDIDYIEAHGTATEMGDPIEVEALDLAFESGEKQYCALGSVKGNIGHLDAAAGIAGLIKTALALKHKTIPPSINYTEANSNIDFENTPFYVNTTCREWDKQEGTRVAGVSSFGIGGTNAHVLLGEAPDTRGETNNKKWHIFPFSAKTESALKNNILSFISFLEKNRDICLADAAYTLQTGRKFFEYRTAVPASSVDELLKRLKGVSELKTPICQEKAPLVYFPGTAVGYLPSLAVLMEEKEVFQKSMAEALYAVGQVTGKFYTVQSIEENDFVLAAWLYSLGTLYRTLGVQKEFLTGEGIGKLAAAASSEYITIDKMFELISCGEELPRNISAEMAGTDGSEAVIEYSRYAGTGITGVYRVICDYWRGGGEVCWEKFHNLDRTGRIPLPTYQFDKMYHWKLVDSLLSGGIGNTGSQGGGSPAAASGDSGKKNIEEIITSIWGKHLGLDGVGMDDDFYALGGHSLAAVSIIHDIRRELGVELSMDDMLMYSTVRELMDYMTAENMIANDSSESAFPRAALQDFYPLSAAQERMYILNKMDSRGTNYNMPYAMWVTGMEKKGLEKAARELVARHESFRTGFFFQDGKPCQKVSRNVDFEVEYYDYIHGCEEELVKSFIRPFDLTQAPLIRVGYAQVSDDKGLLLFDMHHIISDGTSMNIITREFSALYHGETITEKPVQYKDYAVWQHSDEGTRNRVSQENFWLNRFEGDIPVLELASDNPRPAVQSFAGASYEFKIPANISGRIFDLAREENTTLYMTLLAAFNLFLHKYTGQEDIIVGSPIAGRSKPGLENTVGMFVNTLAMRNYPAGDKVFRDFLQEVKNSSAQAFANQDYQFEDLIEKLDIRRDMSRNPLFDVMFSLLENRGTTHQAGTLTFEEYPFETAISKFDLTLTAYEDEGALGFIFEYSTDLFNKDTIERFARHFSTLLGKLAISRWEVLDNISLLSESERKIVVEDFNNTTVDYPAEKAIHTLFEEEAARVPENDALGYEGGILTYRELNEKANRLAWTLKEKGVGPDVPVALLCGKSPDMIVATLAILKAGGGYVPVDPDYPVDRKRFIIEDSGAQILLTHKGYEWELKLSLDLLDLEDQSVYANTADNLENESGPENLAYVMYTSGTTGRPKGVEILHKNVTRLVKNTNYVPFSEDTRILQTGAIVFDASTFEIWGSLLNGGYLYLAEKEVVIRPASLKNAIGEQNINTMWLTSPLFNQLVSQEEAIFTGLEYLLVGGDTLSPAHINKVLKAAPGINIINGYGPTENTTFSTTFLIDSLYEDRIPIGGPIANSTAYILDKNGRPQPIGVAGELCVGGDGLGRGYLNRPELTSEKFIPHPFIQGERIYRTGDLAKWRADGTIDFLGRLDHQVKIRGFRIEPAEIENRILSHENVTEAVVIPLENGAGEKYLCAYIVGATEIPASDYREFILQELPDYMVPSYFVHLHEMPLNRNGKVDRKALPAPEMGEIDLAETYEAPRNEREEKLAEICASVLGLQRVGINDNFFDLGGHSLKGALFISRVQEEMGIEIGFNELFTSPTIKGLGSMIALFNDSEEAETAEAEEREELLI